MAVFSGDSREVIDAQFATMGIVTEESKRNLETVKRIMADLLTGKEENYWQQFTDDSLTAEPASLPYGGDYIGRDAARANGENVLKNQYSSVHYEIKQMAAAEDIVFFLIDITFTKRGTDETLKLPVAELWRLKDGMVIENRPFIFDVAALAKMCISD